MHLSELPTPCAVVDLDVVERNCRAMAERARRLGVRLRPHVKTHKTVEAALLQCAGRPGPITVSTLAEAAFFAEAGFRDITYAVPVSPRRLAAAAELAARLERLSLLVDHPAAAAEVERCARERGVRFGVFVKVDCGGGRAGVDPLGDDGMALATTLAGSPFVDFRGVLTHAGQAYGCRNREEASRVAEVERDVTGGFARRIEAAGVTVPEVSVGSTPTMCAAEDLAGVTEIRPGNYVFFDAFQAAVGSCRLEDCAFTVMVAVIGVYPARRELLVDGGALALSKDPGPVHVDPACGFGLVLDAAGRPLPGLKVGSLSQEHGLVRARPGHQLPELPIGSLLRIIPNHSCLAAALHPSYAAVHGDELVGEWRPVRGW